MGGAADGGLAAGRWLEASGSRAEGGASQLSALETPAPPELLAVGSSPSNLSSGAPAPPSPSSGVPGPADPSPGPLGPLNPLAWASRTPRRPRQGLPYVEASCPGLCTPRTLFCSFCTPKPLSWAPRRLGAPVPPRHLAWGSHTLKTPLRAISQVKTPHRWLPYPETRSPRVLYPRPLAWGSWTSKTPLLGLRYPKIPLLGLRYPSTLNGTPVFLDPLLGLLHPETPHGGPWYSWTPPCGPQYLQTPPLGLLDSRSQHPSLSDRSLVPPDGSAGPLPPMASPAQQPAPHPPQGRAFLSRNQGWGDGSEVSVEQSRARPRELSCDPLSFGTSEWVALRAGCQGV